MVVSSGGGLGKVRFTLRSSELCCRAASWREREKQKEKKREGGVGEEQNMGGQEFMESKELDGEKRRMEGQNEQ